MSGKVFDYPDQNLFGDASATVVMAAFEIAALSAQRSSDLSAANGRNEPIPEVLRF
jgi:hypothetical protein